MAKRGVNAGSIFGTVYIILFAIIWIVLTLSIPLYPVNIAFASIGFLILASGVYNAYRMVKGRKTVQSAEVKTDDSDVKHDYSGYCPYCGSPVERNHDFCSVCGKTI